MEHADILSRIGLPSDLSTLSYAELEALAEEIRSIIVETVSRNGGHLASNLGVVELTIALHRVFSTPTDKIVWDVGHQCYTHKLLTGRRLKFVGLRRHKGLSGFPKLSESEHDSFNTGHSSTSISAALGLLAGDRLLGGKASAIAVIGDGAITGGMAYEGLSHAGQLGLPLIVILNDNKMSIGPNVGALSEYLSRLSLKGRYQHFRRCVDRIVRGIPVFGPFMFDTIVRIKRGVKAVFYPENFFVDLGFEYVGPIDGHNIQALEQVLRDARKLERPVVVHVLTRKGKGYDHAEDDPSSFHGVTPFSIHEGLVERSGPTSFTEAFSHAMVSLAHEDGRIAAITAAMEKGTGLSAFRSVFPARFFDVGIAEQHAVTFAAGLAARGLRPVVALYSTFAQRAMDQILHDAAIQDLPITFALDRSGFVPDDGETHQGLFDLAFFRTIPNLALMAPASAVELDFMLRWSVARARPCAVRYPKAACPHEIGAFSEPLIEGRGVFVREIDSNLLIAFTGSLYPQINEAADLLLADGIQADLYNIRFLKPVDENYLADVLSRYALVVTAEEGMLAGGYGEYLTGICARRNIKTRVVSLGAADHFPTQATRAELLQFAGLDARGLAVKISAAYREPGRFSIVHQSSSS
ncbi:MAG: 1-deoxy-D-xylulose-5-phosphate synthase [Treponemataceae bacterium]